MNVNITLLGEMITFAILVWVTMKYIWPPIQKAMQDRERKIADGLEAAKKGKKSLELAEKKITAQLRETKIEAASIIDQANQRTAQMVEEAKKTAGEAGKKIIALAKSDIVTEQEKAKQQLQKQVATLAINAAEKVLQQKIDMKTNQKLIDKIIEDI